MKQLFLAFCALFFISTGFAASTTSNGNSIVGDWRVIDDQSHQPRSIITIYEENGVYYGKIKKLLAKDAIAICHRCTGEFKDKPTLGLRFLWGAIPSNITDGVYDHAFLLDPKTGNTYESTLELGADGQTLKVHGYAMMPLFDRTETWERLKEGETK